MRRTSCQKGSLTLADRRNGKVWEFRWREVQLDGSVRRKNIVIGTLEDFPNESAAQAAADAICVEINRQTPQQLVKNISVETLLNHYRQHELPDVFSKSKPAQNATDEDRKSYATQVTYEGYLKKWILPRWRLYRLDEVKAVDVEAWLKTLALAKGSKAKIRNIMSALYSHAIRWEWTERNPITSVRQGSKRQKAPDVLTPEEITAVLEQLSDPLRTMVELDAFTGLRRGELIGLRWEDVRRPGVTGSPDLWSPWWRVCRRRKPLKRMFHWTQSSPSHYHDGNRRRLTRPPTTGCSLHRTREASNRTGRQRCGDTTAGPQWRGPVWASMSRIILSGTPSEPSSMPTGKTRRLSRNCCATPA